MSNANGTVAVRAIKADLAPIDPVTGLLNRDAFELRAEVEMSRADRFDRSLGLGLVEVSVNERYTLGGAAHTVETTLAGVGLRILTAARLYDIVARWDDLHIVVLYPEASSEQAHKATVRAVLRTQQAFPGIDLVAGVASRPAADLLEVSDLVLDASRALNAARAAGHRVGVDQVVPAKDGIPKPPANLTNGWTSVA